MGLRLGLRRDATTRSASRPEATAAYRSCSACRDAQGASASPARSPRPSRSLLRTARHVLRRRSLRLPLRPAPRPPNPISALVSECISRCMIRTSARCFRRAGKAHPGHYARGSGRKPGSTLSRLGNGPMSPPFSALKGAPAPPEGARKPRSTCAMRTVFVRRAHRLRAPRAQPRSPGPFKASAACIFYATSARAGPGACTGTLG